MTRLPPRITQPDSTLPLLGDPYRYIGEHAHRLGSNIVRGRLWLRPCTFLVGAEAAALFYDTERFQRAGALPDVLRSPLLGEGGVHAMDGAAHRHRKAMLMRVLMHPEQVAVLCDRTELAWREAADRWSREDEVALYEGLQGLLLRAVCAWAEIPLEEVEADERARQVALLFDAGAGPRHLAVGYARRKVERWLAETVERVRSGYLRPSDGSVLHTIAWHRDPADELLPVSRAAVVLSNVIRPVVALSVSITHAAHALHEWPVYGPTWSDVEATERFVSEVRRYYPFVPAVVARAIRDVDFKGYRIPAGQRVVLDIHGTNHERRAWGDPEVFRPARFIDWAGTPFDLIPQGGGDHASDHRCPGEDITFALMKQAVRILSHRLHYEVSDRQDLRIQDRRMPALPASHFVIHDVRWEERAPRSAQHGPISEELLA